jgi:integrase
MAKTRKAYGTLLTKRRGRYAVKLAVPAKLVKAGSYVSRTGKPMTSVVKILEARTYDAARGEAPGVIAGIRATFDRLLAGRPIDAASVGQIAEQAGRDAYDMLSGKFLTEHERLPKLADELHSLDFWGDVEKPNPLLVGSSTAAFAAQRLKRLNAPATAEAIDRTATAVLTVQRGAVAALLRGIPLPPMPVVRTAVVTPPASDIVARYIQDRKGALVATSVRHVEMATKSLAKHTGGAPVSTVTRADVARWVEAMTVEGAAAASINRHLGTVSRVWRWCQDKGIVGETALNPFTRHWKHVDPDSKWLPFTPAELVKLFDSAVFDPHCERGFATCLPWMMVVGLYSGLRQSEIIGAKVLKHGEHHYFAVGRGKTASAKRNVPCHPELVRIGVVDFYAKGWPRSMAGMTAKRFQAFRLAQGVDRDRLTFHSLRKTFASGLDGVVARDVLSALLGHSRGFSLDTYSPGGPHFQILAEAVGKLHFEGLKL